MKGETDGGYTHGGPAWSSHSRGGWEVFERSLQASESRRQRRESFLHGLGDARAFCMVFGARNCGSWTIIDSEQALGVNLNIKPAM